MKKLEKILEEIEAAFDRRIDIQLKIMAGLGDDVYRYGYKKSLEAYQQGKLFVEDIIHKHMNDGWIPVVRGLPELNEDELSEDVLISFSDSYSICIGFYDFNEKRWYVHGSGPCIGRVVAWRPLPESYRPERSDNNDGE